jgi:hypothetical protein
MSSPVQPLPPVVASQPRCGAAARPTPLLFAAAPPLALGDLGPYEQTYLTIEAIVVAAVSAQAPLRLRGAASFMARPTACPLRMHRMRLPQVIKPGAPLVPCCCCCCAFQNCLSIWSMPEIYPS